MPGILERAPAWICPLGAPAWALLRATDCPSGLHPSLDYFRYFGYYSSHFGYFTASNWSTNISTSPESYDSRFTLFSGKSMVSLPSLSAGCQSVRT